MSPAVEAWSLNRWTAREVPRQPVLMHSSVVISISTLLCPLLVFVNKVVLEHSHIYSFYVSRMAAFLLQHQSWVIVTGTGWPKKPKIFTLWLFTEKVF